MPTMLTYKETIVLKEFTEQFCFLVVPHIINSTKVIFVMLSSVSSLVVPHAVYLTNLAYCHLSVLSVYCHIFVIPHAINFA